METKVLAATDVATAQLDGVAAIEHLASHLRGNAWQRPTPCRGWTVADLIGHLACIAADYNSVIDAITDGNSSAVLRSTDIDEHNAIRLLEIADDSPAIRLSDFGRAARRFAARASAFASLHAFSVGTRRWSVGMYAGMCAIEWHMHAWDLGLSIGLSYRPANVQALLRMWELEFPHLALPGGDGWTALLVVSGRSVTFTAPYSAPGWLPAQINTRGNARPGKSIGEQG